MFNSKKIVDERQERQSHKNGSIVCSVTMMMLGALIFIQTLFLNRGLSYIWPEFITLMTGCVLIFILEIRQGKRVHGDEREDEIDDSPLRIDCADRVVCDWNQELHALSF